MDKQLFIQVCDQIISQTREMNGIGTLSEKTVHSILKNYLSPDTSCHERKVGGFVADIYNDQGIIEIQTRDFNKLRRKLDAFLELTSVMIVYPIPSTKWIRWVNPQTGEVSPPRKSPKQGKPYEIFPELYKIKGYLRNPNLGIQIILLDLEEYRFLDGWSQDKKKGSSRCDRIPTDLVHELLLKNPLDYQALIPDNLTPQFTSKEYKKAAGISLSVAQTGLNILHYLGAVDRVSKKGNSYVYEKTKLS
ncbi:MAG: hypothetical protein K0S47_2327 [Herbinix sp.]|jgi:hypothetical protein|nr:hypothetical protein [Herbinix sp.]